MTAYTSSQSGSWNVAATWGGAGVPVSGDTATVSSGDTVTIDSDAGVGTGTLPVPPNSDPGNFDMVVLGTLKWNATPAADYTFTLNGHTLVGASAVFEIGSEANPIAVDKKATVYFPTGTEQCRINLIDDTAVFRTYGAATYHRADAASQRTTLKTAFAMGDGVTMELNDPVDYEVGDVVWLGMGGDPTTNYGSNKVFPRLGGAVTAGNDRTVIQYSSSRVEYLKVGDKLYFEDNVPEIVTIKTMVTSNSFTADFLYNHANYAYFWSYDNEKVVIQTKINSTTYTVNAIRNHTAGDMVVHGVRNVTFEGQNNAGPYFGFYTTQLLDINWAAFVTPTGGTVSYANYSTITNGQIKIKNTIVDWDTSSSYFVKTPYGGVASVTDEDIDELHSWHGTHVVYTDKLEGVYTTGHITSLAAGNCVIGGGLYYNKDHTVDMKGVWFTGREGVVAYAIKQQGGHIGYLKSHYTEQQTLYLNGSTHTGEIFTLGGGEIFHSFTNAVFLYGPIYIEIKNTAFAQIWARGLDLSGNETTDAKVRNCTFDACALSGSNDDAPLAVGYGYSQNWVGGRVVQVSGCDFGMTSRNNKSNIKVSSIQMTGVKLRLIIDKCRFTKPIELIPRGGLENELAWIMTNQYFTNIYTRMRWNGGMTLELIKPEVYAVKEGAGLYTFTGGTANQALALEGDIAQDFDPAQNTGSFTVIGRIRPDSTSKTGGVMTKWNAASDNRCWSVYQSNSDLKFAVSKTGLAGGDVTEISQSGLVVGNQFFCARYTYVADGTSIMKLEVGGTESSLSNAVGPVHSSEDAEVVLAGDVDGDDFFDGRYTWIAYVNRHISDAEKDDVFAGNIEISDINPDDYLDFGRKVYANSRYPSDIGAHWYRVGTENNIPTDSLGTPGSRLDVDIWPLNKNVDHFTVSGGGGTVQDESVEVIDNTFAVKMHPFTETARNAGTGGQPLLLPVNAGQTITVKLSLKKNKAVAVGKRPAIFLQGLGIVNEAEASAIVDAWEELTVTGTAVTQGMVKFWVSQGANEYDPIGATNATLFPKSPDNITVYADKLVVTRS